MAILWISRNCRERFQPLLNRVCRVQMPVIGAVRQEIRHATLVHPGKPGEGTERWRVTSLAWPQLPVREILEGLRVGRPAPVPLLGSLALAPPARQPESHPRVNPLPGTEDLGYLHPRLLPLTQHAG